MPAPVAPGGPRPTRRYVALMAAIVWVFGLLLFISAFMLPGNYYGFIAFGVDTAVCLFAILALTSHHLVHTLLVATVVAAATAIGVAGLIANSITTVDCDGAVEDRPSVCEYRRVVQGVTIAFGVVCHFGAYIGMIYQLNIYVESLNAWNAANGEPLTTDNCSRAAVYAAVRGMCRGATGSTATRLVVSNRTERPGHDGGSDPFTNNTVSNTKYTVLSFLPKNLFMQFGRFMNVYFLIIALLQLNPTLTPVDPVTTWVPLGMIFFVSAAKEAYDDYLRGRRDRRANKTPAVVGRDGMPTTLPRGKLRCGDVIKVSQNQEVPADCVILKTSEEGAAYIETANIDGETDLKGRRAPQETQGLDDRAVFGILAEVECAKPNASVYSFDSRMMLEASGVEVALSNDNLALAGTYVRNTEWIIGMIVYTGNETKLGMNKSTPAEKWTKLDQFIDRVTIFVFIYQLMATFFLGLAGNNWMFTKGQHTWYLMYFRDALGSDLIMPIRFMLLLSYMIPISLKVSMDLVKFYYAKLIAWDTTMYDPATRTAAVALSTALSEDLGQLEFVLTDKTGTLTENIMRLVKVVIGSDSGNHAGLATVYGDRSQRDNIYSDRRLATALSESPQEVALEFFRCLALNHTVVPARDEQSGDYVYSSASPDEDALVQGAAAVGMRLVDVDGRTHVTTIETPSGATEEHEICAVLEFTSARKRMSVLARSVATGQYTLYCKGADNVMLPRLINPPGRGVERPLDDFASAGLRTLFIARRVLGAAEAEEWLERHQRTSLEVSARGRALAAVYEEAEQDLELLGVTAIEDKLQDGVPETIETLRKAGIKFWVLTGDKVSTAIQIATSCRLMPLGASPDHNLFHITGEGPPAAMAAEIEAYVARARALRAEGNTGGGLSAVIDGAALERVLEHCPMPFLTLALQTDAVVCARVSPAQKAEVVALVKGAGHVCLAIGDGGNDVSMIQEAHVGVGISGREGLQAARAADYAIARFAFLGRLILIHGRESYMRTSFIAQYCFYKSLVISFCQIGYNAFAGYSGVSFYNSFCLTLYNVCFTGLPIFGMLFSRDLSPTQVFAYPQVYEQSQKARGMNIGSMMSWFVLAMFHATILVVVTLRSYDQLAGYDTSGMLAFTALVIVNQCVIYLFSKSMTWYQHILLWGTVLCYFVMTLIYNVIPSSAFYAVFSHCLVDPIFWFGVAVCVVICVAPVVIYCYVQFWYFPSVSDSIRAAVVLGALPEATAVGGPPERANTGIAPGLDAPTMLGVQPGAGFDSLIGGPPGTGPTARTSLLTGRPK